MDGLILDTEPLYKRAWQTAGDALGFPIQDEFYERIIGRRTEDAMVALRKKFGGRFRQDAFNDRWLAEWREMVRREGIPRMTGFDELIEFIEQEGLRTAIATSTERGRAQTSLRAAGLEGRFPVMVTGDEIANGKPAPDIYLEAARRLDVRPRRCIVLEDSEPGVRSAHAAGMKAVMVPDMTEPSDAVREVASRVVSSLHEVRQLLMDRDIDSLADQTITG